MLKGVNADSLALNMCAADEAEIAPIGECDSYRDHETFPASESSQPDVNISRRSFIQSAPAAATLAAFSSLSAEALDVINGKSKRVDVISVGWQGKAICSG